MFIKGSRWAEDPPALAPWLGGLSFQAQSFREQLLGGTGYSLTLFLARLHTTTPTSVPVLPLSPQTGREHWKALLLLAMKF